MQFDEEAVVSEDEVKNNFADLFDMDSETAHVSNNILLINVYCH